MKRTKELVLISLYVAMCIALDVAKEFLPFLNMPSGGSVNIALIPVVISSFHLGYKKGMLIGFMWFIVSSIVGLNKYFISIGQIILDYIIPSMILGLSSIFYKKKNTLEIELGILLMMFIRTISICISGIIYWMDNKNAIYSMTAWAGNLAYNLPYSLATLLMLLIITPILLKTLKKYLV